MWDKVNFCLCMCYLWQGMNLVLFWEIFQDSQAVLTGDGSRSGESNCASQHLWVSSSSCDSTSSGGGFELLLFPSVVRWPPRRPHLPILLLEVENMLGWWLLGWRWCGGGRSSARTMEKWTQWCETTGVMSELWWWKDNFYDEDEGDLKKDRQDVYFRPQWGWHRDCNKGLDYLLHKTPKNMGGIESSAGSSFLFSLEKKPTVHVAHMVEILVSIVLPDIGRNVR